VQMHHKSLKIIKIRAVFLLLVCSFTASAATTRLLFQSDSLSVGPFPANALTSLDPTQKTGVRINLPSSADTCDPTSGPAVCSNSTLLNQLDGFSVNPRLMACFSAPVNITTLKSGIHFVPANGGSVVGINQLIYDPNSNCAFAKPNQVLNQQRQYLLVVSGVVRDTLGKDVGPDPKFGECLKSSDQYCQALQQALQRVGGAEGIIGASLFTTMSATGWLEQARRYVDATEPPLVIPAGTPTSFALSNLKSITWNPAQSASGPQDIPLSALSGVGRIAFGEYLTPIFQNVVGPAAGTISVTPTNLPLSGPTITAVPVSFHVFVPNGSPPPGGFPVVIYGHGLGDNQFGAPTFIASTLAKSGFATLAIEITGHGYGPDSTVTLTDKSGTPHTVATPGRGILLPGNSEIGPTDGCIVPGALAIRDCGRQTAIDLFALVQTIRGTQGLGLGLNPGRISYIGQSFGGTYGTLFQAVEPKVRAAVLNGDGGSSVDVARLAITGRPLAEEYLASVNPALLNVASGAAPAEAYFHDAFNDNYVFRDTAPVTNSVPGAMAIQAAFEAADWLGMLGDPLSYAPHLQLSPLAGVPVKSTLFQFGLGDLEVPNPTESAVIRAASARGTAWYLRFDEAVEMAPDLAGLTYAPVGFPILPHRILSNPTVFAYADEKSISMAEQWQAAAYFASYGFWNPNPNWFLTGPFAGTNLFQIPTTLPEQLNYFQLSP
jgi:dienelactone hydrolase